MHFNRGWPPHEFFGIGGPIIMGIIGLAVIGLLIYLAVMASRNAGGRGGDRFTGISGGESALDILEKRYARGEISRDEFEEMKKTLLKR